MSVKTTISTYHVLDSSSGLEEDEASLIETKDSSGRKWTPAEKALLKWFDHNYENEASGTLKNCYDKWGLCSELFTYAIGQSVFIKQPRGSEDCSEYMKLNKINTKIPKRRNIIDIKMENIAKEFLNNVLYYEAVGELRVNETESKKSTDRNWSNEKIILLDILGEMHFNSWLERKTLFLKAYPDEDILVDSFRRKYDRLDESLIAQIERENPGIRDRMTTQIQTILGGVGQLSVNEPESKKSTDRDWSNEKIILLDILGEMHFNNWSERKNLFLKAYPGQDILVDSFRRKYDRLDKSIIAQIERENPGVRDRMTTQIQTILQK